MLTNVLDLVGRMFISAIFLLSGVNKIQNYDVNKCHQAILKLNFLINVSAFFVKFTSH